MTATIDRELIKAGLDWLHDCFDNEDGELDGLSDREVRAGVDRHYEGGWEQFLRDGFYEA